MDDKKRLLIVTQEMNPYILQSTIADNVRFLAQNAQENGMEIRLLMPRFGSINERRHRLHEVVRLSGINIIIEDDDYPLIIKVASLPGARMQVYFLDNEDFFKRKTVFHDEEEKFFEDNIDRMIFFCKGVLETVKKFGWPPDLIHCHGWLTALIPMYLKTAYLKDPIFDKSKVIYSAYENTFKDDLGKEFYTKAVINRVKEEDLKPYPKSTVQGMDLGAISYADAIIQGDESIEKKVLDAIKADKDKPFLGFHSKEDYLVAYNDFYTMLLAE